MKNILSSKKTIWALVNAIVFIVLVGIWLAKGGAGKPPSQNVSVPDMLDALALNAPGTANQTLADDFEVTPVTGQTVDSTTTTLATITRVIDGDTVELSTGQRVRYIGVDTPETLDPRKGVQCFGKEASAYNKSIVLNQKVRLAKDVSDMDRYHRLLRYVYLEDGTLLNLKLVEEGYAKAATFPPDVKYSKVFVAAEAAAREAGKGLWAKCQ